MDPLVPLIAQLASRAVRFVVIGVPVARLVHLVTSKHAAGRDKDRLFLATHRQALEDLLRREPR